MYDPDAFRRTHDKILKAIGAEHIRFHDLRHTFATLSAEKRVDVKTLSGALGHYSAGVHPEHLHPRHGPDETGCRGHHRRGHQPADALKKQGQTGKILSGPVRYSSGPFPVWVRCES